MRIRDITCVAAAAMLLAGCFSLESAKEPAGGREAVARNFGYYLFDCVPLFCGNAADNPSCPFVMFRNDVTADKLQARLAGEAKRRGADLDNLVWSNRDSVFIFIPFMYVQLPIPYILTYREMQLSGVMK